MRLLAVFIFPAIAFAQGQGADGSRLASLILSLRRIVNLLIPLAMGIALLWLFWQMTMLIAHADDPEARKRGRRAMVVGIMALTVMSSIWGIVAFIQDAFGISSKTTQDSGIVVPQAALPTSGSLPAGPQ